MTNFLSGVLGGTNAASTLEPQRQNNALLHLDNIPGIADEEFFKTPIGCVH